MTTTVEVFTPDDLVVRPTPDGWSLHAPGSTDEAIADGSAPCILCGEGRPTAADRDKAFRLWRNWLRSQRPVGITVP